jgi:hypothetical protein
MGNMRCGQGRKVWCFLLSAAAACFASGNALATCSLGESPPAVPCYMRVQPIDVANVQNLGLPPVATVVHSPFNTTSMTVDPTTAGLPLQGPTTVAPPTPNPNVPPLNNIPLTIPNNSLSPNPIGFVVDPATGQFPGDGVSSQWPRTGQNPVDVTRELLRNSGVDVVWLPMVQYVYNNNNPGVSACSISVPAPPSGSCFQAMEDFTTLNVTLASTNTNVATSCMGFISGTTLTITSACSGTSANPNGNLVVYDFLSSTATGFVSGTYISGSGTGSGGIGTYTVNTSQTVGSSKRPVAFTAMSSTLTSALFKTLSQQDTTVTTPVAISKGGTPVAPLGGAGFTSAPDPAVVNLFLVNTLNPPPAIGGTLYGLAWICNNGVAISSQTFAQSRPDTIAHELLHNLCLDHGTYGAGSWTAPASSGPPYAAPFGVVPTIPGTAVPGQCDSHYPACGANLMTTGINRIEPTLACILAGYPDGTGTIPSACLPPANNRTSQSPGFFNSNAPTDHLTSVSSGQGLLSGASSAQLPVTQLGQAVDGLDRGLSGLLFTNTPTLQFSGLLSPIPQETTKAQLGTGGSSTDRAIFDVSAPIGGKPGETLLGWVLTLPQEQTFAKHDRFHIVSQSRKDLVQDVRYYPGPGNNPLKRNIAYQPRGDNNADNPSIPAADPGPCAFATAECLVVKFQPPGLGADDSISFSNSILSGDAPITNEDLCKAKITYIFSDGYITTSNFGRCPPVSLPLIASSWHPDPHVAPHVVQSNLLLADGGSSSGCTPIPGSNPPVCPDVDATSIADSDALTDAGAPQHSCDNGATMKGSANNPVTGVISGPEIIITGGQTCYYQDCHFLGSLTINNATGHLKHCQVDGLLTMNSGTLDLEPLVDSSTATSVFVKGVTQIGNPQVSAPNSFSIGPGANFQGGLTIQNLPSGGLGYVCGSTVSGGLTVNKTQSLIQVGESGSQTNCPINTIGGGFSCKNNTPAVTGGGNTVTGGISGCPK